MSKQKIILAWKQRFLREIEDFSMQGLILDSVQAKDHSNVQAKKYFLRETKDIYVKSKIFLCKH